MTARIVDFKAEHMGRLIVDEAVSYLRPHLTNEVLRGLEMSPLVHSVEHDGKIVACGGISLYWANRGEAWIFFDRSCRTNFVPVFRVVKQWIERCPVRRIEAAVDIDSQEAHRWVKLLGFKPENQLARAYRPDGKDCAIYARVK